MTEDLNETVSRAAQGWGVYMQARRIQEAEWKRMKVRRDLSEARWLEAADRERAAAYEWDRTHGYALTMTTRAVAVFADWVREHGGRMMPTSEWDAAYRDREEWQEVASGMGVDASDWPVARYYPYRGQAIHPLTERVEDEMEAKRAHLDTLEWINARSEVNMRI